MVACCTRHLERVCINCGTARQAKWFSSARAKMSLLECQRSCPLHSEQEEGNGATRRRNNMCNGIVPISTIEQKRAQISPAPWPRSARSEKRITCSARNAESRYWMLYLPHGQKRGFTGPMACHKSAGPQQGTNFRLNSSRRMSRDFRYTSRTAVLSRNRFRLFFSFRSLLRIGFSGEPVTLS